MPGVSELSKPIAELTASNGAKVRIGVSTGFAEPFLWLSHDDDSQFNREKFDEYIDALLDARRLLWGVK